MAKDKQRRLRLRGVRAADDPTFGGPAKPYEGVGRTLAQTREQRGEALADVAAQLRIRHPYLQAIEDGRFDDLPGRIYAIGFLRSYSEYLGLDEAAVIAAFKAESTPEPENGKLNFPVPPPESRMPGTGIVAFALIVGIAIYGGWAYIHRHDVSGVVVPLTNADGVPTAPGAAGTTEVPLGPTPGAAQAPSTAAAPAAGATPSVPAAAPATAGAPAAPGTAGHVPGETPSSAQDQGPAPAGAAVEPSPAPAAPANPAATAAAGSPAAVPPATAPAAASPAAEAANPPAPSAHAAPAGTATASTAPGATADHPAATSPTAPAATPAPANAAPASGQVYGVTQGSVRVVLEATANSWINIQAPGKVLVAGRVLKPGDRYRVPDEPGVTLWTGNLGGLEIFVDGKKIRPLGRTGEARRDISLEPSRLLAGTEMGN